MSIVGLPFDQGVKTQLNQRGKLMANSPERGSLLGIEPDQSIYIQNKTAWVRLASAVDIKNPDPNTVSPIVAKNIRLRVEELTSNLDTTEGNALARRFVLTQGTRGVDRNGNFSDQKSGIGSDSAYGIGGDAFGYRPMPALQSINVSYYNRGALAKADIKIKVFNVEQLSYIETLYLRPGYTLLLEWGHTAYITNTGQPGKAELQGTPVLRKFFNPPKTPVFKPKEASKTVKPAGKESQETVPGIDTSTGEVKLTGFLMNNNLRKGLQNPQSDNLGPNSPDAANRREINEAIYNPVKPLSLKTPEPNTPFQASTAKIIYRDIITERIKWGYNYDGFYGKVTNFNWTFNDDGSYDIIIKAITTGDVIESLRINPTVVGNTNLGLASPSDRNKVESITERNFLKFLKSDSPEEQRIEGIYEQAQGNSLINGLFQVMLLGTQPDNGQIGTSNQTVFSQNLSAQGLDSKQKVNIYRFADQKLDLVRTALNIREVNPGEIIEIEYTTSKEDQGVNLGKGQFYMTLGCFLRYIEENFLIYSQQNTTLLSIDSNYFKSDGVTIGTPMSTFPGHVSGDPTVCIIPGNYIPEQPNQYSVDREIKFARRLGITEALNEYLDRKLKAPFVSKENPFVGNLMSVYVNFDTIIQSTTSNIDDDGNIKFINFIKAILSKVKEALGGINDFQTRYIEEENKFSIYEQTSHTVDQYNQDRSKLTTFSGYGLNKGKGSIVKKLAFNSELTNDFATQISIGAQANGNQVGTPAVGLSTYNQGLVDRLEPAKLTTTDNKTSQSVAEGRSVYKIITKMLPLLTTMYAANPTDRKLSQAKITALRNLNKEYAKYMQGYWVQEKQASQPPSFIPFNLQVTLEGISGIRLFERFILDDSILPYSYRNKVDFLVKNITHTVQNEVWETKLETLAIPRLTSRGGRALVKKPQLKPETSIFTTRELEKINSTPSGRTLILGLPLEKIYQTRKTKVQAIYLHHTAGTVGSPATTIADWNSRPKGRASAHYVIGGSEYDQLVDSTEYFTWHARPSSEEGNRIKKAGYKTSGGGINAYSVGIEIQSPGYLVKKNGKYYTDNGIEVDPSNQAVPVDFFGNPLKGGYKYNEKYYKYNDYQINTLEKILLKELRLHNIPFVWRPETYNEMFPNAVNFNGLARDVSTYKGNLSKKALALEPGVYSHNSSRIDKSDVFPQKELLDMLKRVSDTLLKQAAASTTLP